MDINKFIENVNRVDWNSFGGSTYYISDRVPIALISLAISEYEEPITIKTTCDTNYNTIYPRTENEVLFAIGNNHSGTYYLAIYEALRFIIEVALEGNNEFSRNHAINILYDLYHFSPDNGDSNLENFVRTTITDKKEDFIKLACTDIYNQPLVEEFFDSIKNNIESQNERC